MDIISKDLTLKFGRGFSKQNLENMRKFYQTYSTKNEEFEIPQSVIREFKPTDLKLPWTHYQLLIRITNRAERSFYEIETASNNWSVRELKRQIDSGLYERLAISKDTDQVRKLSEQGQVITEAKDLIKEPYIL